MTRMLELTRRGFLVGATVTMMDPLTAQELVAPAVMRVSKAPNCGCCSGWVEHIQAAGFQTLVIEMNDLAPLKARLKVPSRLASCHTAEIGGFVIEGHVPAAAIRRLLSERPAAIGLAVPGMPVGSPGMEVSGAADEPYEVMLFGPSGDRSYGRFVGSRAL
jgi:hypothetical protein